MKKCYILVLITILFFTSLPMSAKKVFLITNQIDIDFISLEGGTYLGSKSFTKELDLNTYFSVYGHVFEFDDSQTTTRLHVNNSNVRTKVYEATYDQYGLLYEKGSLIIDSGETPIPNFVSDEIDIEPMVEYGYVDFKYLHLDFIKFHSVTSTLLGDGLSADLRDNFFVEFWVSSIWGTGAYLSGEGDFTVLYTKSAPYENYVFTNLCSNNLTYCIDGFDWSDPHKSLLVILNGDTIKDLRSHKESLVVYREGYGQISREGNGVDLPVNDLDNTVYAELMDVPEIMEFPPVTYANDYNGNITIKSVDKSYSGGLILKPNPPRYYSDWTKVTGIEDQAMLNCKYITSLHIPATIKNIGINALSGMSALQQITVASDNNNLSSVNGVLYSKSGATLIQFPIAKATEFEVPEGTVTIGRDAFYQSKLTSLILPSSLTTIGYDAFGYCRQLTDIVIPSNVNTIGEFAFDHCTNLNSINIPASVKTIGANAFNRCNALTSVNCYYFPVPIADNTFPETVYENAVLHVPVLALEAYQNADGWKLFKNIVGDIDEDVNIVFADSKVKSICVTNWDTNGDHELSLNEAAAVTSIGSAFSGNTSIISFKELVSFVGLTQIDDEAFNGCRFLASIIVPENVKRIGKKAFYACYDLTDIVLPEGLEVIDEKGISACTKLTSIKLPSTLNSIKKYGFYYNTKLTSISLPAGITSIGNYAFAQCNSLWSVTANMETPFTIAANVFDGNTYSKATLHVPNGKIRLYKTTDFWSSFQNVVDMDGNTEQNIADYIVFADPLIESICLTNWDTNGDLGLDVIEAAAVTSLGGAFSGNTSITSFNELAYFTGLTKIEDEAFNGCKLLTSVVVPENVKQIGKKAFYGCYKLTNIVLPEGLEIIDERAISACIGLTTIDLPSTLNSIKKYGFYYNTKLTSISLPAGITSIGDYAFAQCNALMDITANMQPPCTISSTVFTTDVYNNALLHIPYGTYEIYKNTNYWSKFVNIIMESGGTEISASPISIVAGENGILNLSLFGNIPIVSFQFDLTLANEITLEEASVIPPSDFVVTKAYLGSYKWRILAYSPTNTPINANIGNLMALTLQTVELMTPGTRTVTFTNISTSSVRSDNVVQSFPLDNISTTINIVAAAVTDAGKGDVNLDGTVNVQDIVVLINHIFGSTPRKFSSFNADANSDGNINVADVSAIVILCMPGNTTSPAPAHAPAANLASVTWDTSDGLSLTIGDARNYVATQMDIITEGTLRLNGITTEGSHSAAWQQIGDNRYRVLVFSNANDTFSAFGPHLYFDMEGDGTVALNEVLLVDAEGEGYMAEPSSTGYTTGITTLTTDLSAPADVYSVSGQIVRQQTTSLKNLPAGIYIVNGRKMVVK